MCGHGWRHPEQRGCREGQPWDSMEIRMLFVFRTPGSEALGPLLGAAVAPKAQEQEPRSSHACASCARLITCADRPFLVPSAGRAP